MNRFNATAFHRLLIGGLCLVLALPCTFSLNVVGAQEPSEPVKKSPDTILSERQNQLTEGFTRLEQLMLRMADIDDSSNNPQRAELLREAVRASKEKLISTQMETLVALLGDGKLKRATDGQTEVSVNLLAILKMLQSENRDDQNKSEQERIKSYIKKARQLKNKQRSIQGRTEGGDDAEKIAKDQKDLTEETGDLADKIKTNEENETGESKDGEPKDGEPKDGEPKDGEPKDGEPKDGEPKDGEPKDGEPKDGEPKDGEPKDGEPKDGEPKDGEPKDGEPKDGEPKDGEPKDGEPKDGEPKDGEPKDGEPKDGEPKDGEPKDGEPKDGEPKDGEPKDGEPKDGEPKDGEPKDGEPKDGQPKDGQPKDGQPKDGQPKDGEQQEQQQQEQQENEFPARKRIEEAQRRMEQAQKKLDEAKRDEAIEEQQKAQSELAKAIAELEEILRQLREEEIERVLARLEARFSKMLEMQLNVYDDTERLAKIPVDQRGTAEDIQAGKLSFAEKQIVIEADKALELLIEEGSSIAFPEAVQQMRDDMQLVAERLSGSKVDSFTLSIEQDIIDAIEELIESLKQAQKDQEEREKQEQQQQPQQQQMPPGEEALVNIIAELKLIRLMQIRINKRTNRIANLLPDLEDLKGQATTKDMLEMLKDLSKRQQKIQRITRDNIMEKNK